MFMTPEQMDQRLEKELARAKLRRDHIIKISKAAGVDYIIDVPLQGFEKIDLSGLPSLS